MKKAFALLTVLMVFCLAAKAQDLIVTEKGDTLNAKIIRFHNRNVTYVYQKDGKLRYEIRQRDKLKYFCSGYYEEPGIDGKKALEYADSYKKYRLAVNAGLAAEVLDTKVVSEYRNKSAQIVFQASADFSYFIRNNFGIGVEYSASLSSLSGGALIKEQNVGIHQLIPMVVLRRNVRKKTNTGWFAAGAGWIHYRAKGHYYMYNPTKADHVLITGNSAAVKMAVGYDMGLSETLALGLQLNANASVIPSFNLKFLDKSDSMKYSESHFKALLSLQLGLRLLK